MRRRENKRGGFLYLVCWWMTEFSHWRRLLIPQRRNCRAEHEPGALVGVMGCNSSSFFLHHGQQSKVFFSVLWHHFVILGIKVSSGPTISKMWVGPWSMLTSNRTEPYLDLEGHNMKRNYFVYKPYSTRLGLNIRI